MEENKTTRVNRTVNYYSDRPDYDRHMEKHNCHCERPHYDHCPEKPEYDRYPERPHYDHCPLRPEYDHHPLRPNHDHYPSKPDYDHHPVRPNYDHYPVKPEYDHHPVRPNYDHYPVKPDYDHHPVRPNHDCYEENPQYDQCNETPQCNCYEISEYNNCCPERDNCDPRQEKTKPSNCCCPQLNLHSNGCGSCCKPLKLNYPDISCAVCSPILANKIFDVKYVKQKICRAVTAPQIFTVDTRPLNCPPYADDAPVCIEKVGIVYDCIGFANVPLSFNLCGLTGTIASLPQICCDGTTTLSTTYEGTIPQSCSCNNQESSATLIQGPLQLTVVNLQYIVEGFIGCEPFVARFTDGSTLPPGPYAGINLCGNLCLPKPDGPLTLRAEFDLKFSVKSIVPVTSFDATARTFTANIFDELLIKEKLYTIKSEDLIVYSAPDKLK